MADKVMDIVLVVGLSYFGPTPRNRPDWYTQLGTTSFSISLATNTIVTAILILRLVMVHREVRKIVVGRNHYLVEIVAMLIESGALTFISQLIWVVLFSLQNISTGFDAIAAVTALSCVRCFLLPLLLLTFISGYRTNCRDCPRCNGTVVWDQAYRCDGKHDALPDTA